VGNEIDDDGQGDANENSAKQHVDDKSVLNTGLCGWEDVGRYYAFYDAV
jgi:hypothetical protein